MICSWFGQNALKKQGICWKKTYFSFVLTFFHIFPPFLCPRANCSCRSSFSCSFLKSDRSNSLSLLFKNERPWANHSHRSVQKSDHEPFAPVAHDKRATPLIHSFSQANCSVAHKKKSTLLVKLMSEFQPCLEVAPTTFHSSFNQMIHTQHDQIIFYSNTSIPLILKGSSCYLPHTFHQMIHTQLDQIIFYHIHSIHPVTYVIDNVI